MLGLLDIASKASRTVGSAVQNKIGAVKVSCSERRHTGAGSCLRQGTNVVTFEQKPVLTHQHICQSESSHRQ